MIPTEEINQYIAERPEWQRKLLVRLRQLIHSVDPSIEEAWRWNAPHFDHNDHIMLGMMAFKAMKIQNFPDIDLPTVTVTASLPGASPAQLETEVARKIENSIATLQGVKHIYTTVQDGSAIVTTEFRLEKPTQEAVDDVRAAVARVRSDLPTDLRDPVVTKMEVPSLDKPLCDQIPPRSARVAQTPVTTRALGAISITTP